MRPEAGRTEQPCPNCEILQRTVTQLQEQIRELSALLQTQGERIAQLEREASRQAAPFRRPEKKRKPNPKPPGSKKGHPPSHRMPPPTVDECVQAPLDRCPECGGPVHDLQPLDQIVEDIPPLVVRRTRIRTYRGRCKRCGIVRSVHPQ